jgi:hypothetical protein
MNPMDTRHPFHPDGNRMFCSSYRHSVQIVLQQGVWHNEMEDSQAEMNNANLNEDAHMIASLYHYFCIEGAAISK